MVNILFVCSGDTCRSPIISAIFNDEIRKANKSNVVMSSSAGLFVNPSDTEISEDAKFALREFNILNFSHMPTSLTEDLVIKSDLIICVNSSIKNCILTKMKNTKNVKSVSDYIAGVEIADPFGKGRAVYLKLCSDVKVLVIKLIDILCKEGVILWLLQ